MFCRLATALPNDWLMASYTQTLALTCLYAFKPQASITQAIDEVRAGENSVIQVMQLCIGHRELRAAQPLIDVFEL